MLEEAAGTRLYEQKKDAAIKTIEKKSRKVDEITTVSRPARAYESRACTPASEPA
jgi:chromosome segregation ATPase